MPKTIKIIIIGAGPVGLSFAISVLNKAKDTPSVAYEIDFIELRDLNFTRAQKIIIRKDPTCLNGVSWQNFCEQTFFPLQRLTLDNNYNMLVDGELPVIKTYRYRLMEKWLRHGVNPSTFPMNCSIKQLQRALLEHLDDNKLSNATINWHLRSFVQTIDLKANQLTLNDGNKLDFQFLVNCEGEKGSTIPIINSALESIGQKNKKFTYRVMANEETYHMAVKMRVKPQSADMPTFIQHKRQQYLADRDTRQLVADFKAKFVYLEDDKTNIESLSFLYDPNMYKQHLQLPNWTPKFYVAGRIPKMLHVIEPESKPQILVEWAAHLIAAKFSLPPDILELDPGSQSVSPAQRAGTFTYFPKYVNHPLVTLASGAAIAFLGDVALSPNYWFGISSTLGLNQARALANCIPNPTKASYERFIGVYLIYRNYIGKTVKYLAFSPQRAPLFFKENGDSFFRISAQIKMHYLLTRSNHPATCILDTKIIMVLKPIATAEVNKLLNELDSLTTSKEIRQRLKQYMKDNYSYNLGIFSLSATERVRVLLSELLIKMDHYELRNLRAYAYELESSSILANEKAQAKAAVLHDILDSLFGEVDCSTIIKRLEARLDDPSLNEHRIVNYLAPPKSIRLMQEAIDNLRTAYLRSDRLPPVPEVAPSILSRVSKSIMGL